MAKKDGVVIRIDGDISGFEKELEDAVKGTEEAAQKIEESLSGAAESLTDGMAEAWQEAKKEQENATKAITKNVEKITSQNQELIGQKNDIGDVYDDLGDSAKSASQKVKAGLADVKAGIDMATAAMRQLASVAGKGIAYNATIEQMQTSFEVMTGSAEKAAEVVERLRLMGAETPFETTDLVNTTQLLMQYGFTADDALDKMRMLGDIAQGNTEAMNSIALGYAQMSSAGKVNLVDIKQMINGGFNPLQEISERTGESMASLYDRISKGSMQIDEITTSMQMATSEGGKFYQSMEKQSRTLSGQLSTLKDNTDQLLGSLTAGFSAGLKDELLPLANNMIGELQDAFSANGTQGLVNAATEMIPRLLDMMTGGFEEGIEAVGKWLPKGAKALMKSIPGALRSAGDVAPQITTVLFEVASTVLTGLTGMLPELIPAVVQGFSDTLGAALIGMEKLASGFFSGIEQMFHQGQTKIAGIWVDKEQVAKYDFKILTDVVDTTEPESAIHTAYEQIRTALNTDLLTEGQKDEIYSMIGGDYQDIYDKLISFNLPPQDADVIAAQVTASGEAILAEIGKLDIEVDDRQVLKWMVQANDSRIALKTILMSEGLSDEDINEVVAVFDDMRGDLASKTPNVAEEIYDILTDGLADDPVALKQKVTDYLEAQDKAIEEAYAASVAALDPTDTDYADKLAKLNADYAAAKADLQAIGTDLNTVVDTLANASTTTVQSKYQLLADLEAEVNGLAQRIDELTTDAMEAGQIAFNVVRSGAKADEATISQALTFKVTQFHLDVQSAEDAYEETVAGLNEKLAKKEISVEEYDAEMMAAQSELDAVTQTATEAYETALKQIFSGIAEAEGMEEAIQAAGKELNLADSINAFIESGFGAGMDEETKAAIESDLIESIEDVLGEDIARQIESYITAEDIPGLASVMGTWASVLMETAKESLQTAEGSKLAEVYSAALSEGVLEGTSFDTEKSDAQLSALFSGLVTEAAATAKSEVEAAGEDLGEAATENMSDYEGANAAGEDTARGLDIALAKAVHMARARGEQAGVAFAGGYKRTMMIQSPSKVMEELGQYTGDGLSIGLQESMAKAVSIAKQMTGQIATAADIQSTARINFSGLQQEIVAANEQTATPVYLDGKQIAEIQGLNNSTQIAWQNTKAAKGVGSK